MGIFDKVGSFIKREADDLGDAAEGIKEKFDQELTKREHELEMTPSEKIAALQQQAAASDAQFDAIAEKATGREAMADAVAEVGELSEEPLPNVTHIVLPDGQVKTGERIDHVVDASGNMRDVPLVQAPTPEDLQKFDEPAPVAQTAPAASSNAATGAPAPFEFPAPEMPEPPMDLSAPQPTVASEGIDAPMPTIPDATNLDTPAPTIPDATNLDTPAPTIPDATNLDTPPSNEPAASEVEPTAPTSSPDYGKTPAQIKYEQARAAANDLLDELRGELKDEGEI